MAFASGLVWIAAGVPAETLRLPAEVPLREVERVRLELRNAEVTVRVDREAPPGVQVSAERPGGPGSIEVELSGAAAVVRRTDPAEPHLRVDVSLAPAQDLELMATEVGLRLEGPPSGGAEEGSIPSLPGDRPEPFSYRLVLDRCRADVGGVRNLALDSTDSAVWLRQTRGLLAATLSGGSLEGREHRGPLQLTSTAAEVKLLDGRGPLTLRLAGGSVELHGGGGRLSGVARDTVLTLEGWSGELGYQGEGGRFEARSADRSAKPWSLRAAGTAVVTEDLRGPLDVDLDGASWNAGTIGGAVQLVARGGSDVELEEVGGPVAVRLFDGTSARLARLAGKLTAEVESSHLEVDGVDTLTVQAKGSQVSGRAIARLGPLVASDSDLDLDLTDLERNAALDLKGATGGTVVLPTPCIVRPLSDDPRLGDHLLVTGCDLRLDGLPARPARSRLVYGARPPRLLTVRLAEGVTLSVDGRFKE